MRLTLCRECHDEADARVARACTSASSPDDGMDFAYVAAVVRGEGVIA